MWQRIDSPVIAGSSAKKRLVAGLMSGTSLDGVDVAIVELRGSGNSLEIDIKAFESIPYPMELKERILKNTEPSTSSVAEIAKLNAELAHVYADAVKSACVKHHIPQHSLELVGSHGQTIYHDPNPTAGIASTLQIGDPAVLSHLLGRPVVGEFRQADIALGGQGAPLVPYFDWALFTATNEYRVLLNLGGIANVSILPAGCRREDVIAFDTGPANVVIDSLMKHYTGSGFDDGGQFALGGKVDTDLLAKLLENPYFAQSAPKSTGRELFNAAYVSDLISEGQKRRLSDRDVVATATELTIKSILESMAQAPPDRLIVSGGGVHNKGFMAGLSAGLPRTKVDSIAQHGIDPDAKEAICFAVLAYEAMNGVSAGMPSVTGANGSAFLGKICFPGK